MSDLITGTVAPGFEEVRREFARNFSERGEIGAAVAAYWHGQRVVDLWGGRRTPRGGAPWNEDTMVVVMSSTKGMAALAVALASSRGWLDYESPVIRYWPEFGQNGKEGITVRQLLGHQAGLVLLDERLTIDRMRDLDGVARLLAQRKPEWEPGTKHGYHTISLGLYEQELIRRVDPKHRTLGQFFHEELAVPLGLEFYIGLPAEIPEQRLARVKTMSWLRGVLAMAQMPAGMRSKVLGPGSIARRSFLIDDLEWNDRRSLEVEIPAGNGVGTARAMAKAYSVFAEGGDEIGLSPETFEKLTESSSAPASVDAVLGVPSRLALGFMRPAPPPGFSFGASAKAFGTPGSGGSFAYADPDAHLGYAYVMNKLDFHFVDDPRELALRTAIYRSMRSAPPPAARLQAWVQRELGMPPQPRESRPEARR